MWNISTGSAKYLSSHHFKCQSWPEKGKKSSACCEGGAPRTQCSYVSGLERITSLEVSSSSGSEYSVWSLIRTGWNGSLCCRKIGQGTKVLSGHSQYNHPEMLSQQWLSPKSYEQHDSYQVRTSHAPKAWCNMYHSIHIVHLVGSFSVDLWLTWCSFRFRMSINGFPFPISIQTTFWRSKPL